METNNFKEQFPVRSGAAQTAGCVKLASPWLSRKQWILVSMCPLADWIGKAPITLTSWRAVQMSYLANGALNSTSSKLQVSGMRESQYQKKNLTDVTSWLIA